MPSAGAYYEPAQNMSPCRTRILPPRVHKDLIERHTTSIWSSWQCPGLNIPPRSAHRDFPGYSPARPVLPPLPGLRQSESLPNWKFVIQSKQSSYSSNVRLCCLLKCNIFWTVPIIEGAYAAPFYIFTFEPNRMV